MKDNIFKWLCTCILLKIADITTTLLSISKSAEEFNPITKNMLQAYGVIEGLVVNTIIYTIFVIVLYHYKQKQLLIITSILMTIVVITNIADKILGVIYF